MGNEPLYSISSPPTKCQNKENFTLRPTLTLKYKSLFSQLIHYFKEEPPVIFPLTSGSKNLVPFVLSICMGVGRKRGSLTLHVDIHWYFARIIGSCFP